MKQIQCDEFYETLNLYDAQEITEEEASKRLEKIRKQSKFEEKDGTGNKK